jgi:hypothetical protein
LGGGVRHIQGGTGVIDTLGMWGWRLMARAELPGTCRARWGPGPLGVPGPPGGKKKTVNLRERGGVNGARGLRVRESYPVYGGSGTEKKGKNPPP